PRQTFSKFLISGFTVEVDPRLNLKVTPCRANYLARRGAWKHLAVVPPAPCTGDDYRRILGANGPTGDFLVFPALVRSDNPSGHDDARLFSLRNKSEAIDAMRLILGVRRQRLDGCFPFGRLLAPRTCR